MLVAGHDGDEVLDGVEDVGVGDVQRREAEAGDVRGPEVADDAALDECLHDAVGRGVPQRDLAAAPGVLARRDHLERRPETLVHQREEVVGQRQRRLAEYVDRHPVERVERGVERRQREDRRGPRGHACDPVRRGERALHVERPGVAEPAGDGLLPGALVTRMHPREGGGAGAAVEVLVRAADGDVRVRAEQVDRHRARRVAQVPLRQGAHLVRGRREPGQVEHRAGAEVDVRQRQHGDVAVEGGGGVGRVAPAQLEPEGASDAGGDVPVGREGRRLEHHDPSVGPQPRGGDERLEQRHRRRVADVHVTPVHADQRRDLGADSSSEADPVGVVPRRDQTRAATRRRPPAPCGR